MVRIAGESDYPKSDGDTLYASEVNKFRASTRAYSVDSNLSKGTEKRIYIHIDSTGTFTPVVKLWLYGNVSTSTISEHYHRLGTTESQGDEGYQAGNIYKGVDYNADSGKHVSTDKTIDITGTDDVGIVAGTDIPQAVTIWIDGVEKTATIGDPNSKGATMYDSGNDDWGVDGTTAWNTGELDLSGLITWSAGEHYIDIKIVTTGGRIMAAVYVSSEDIYS